MNSASRRAAPEPPVDVYAEIRTERERQDAQWGGPKHDDAHSLFDWRSYREKFEERIYRLAGDNSLAAEGKCVASRDALLKIAALAVAQIAVIDRRRK